MALATFPGVDGGSGIGPTVDASPSTIAVDAAARAPVMLPGGRFASDAEYLHQGDDLLLIGADGTTVVVRDYFLTDSPPDLLTPEGGRVTPEIVSAFTPPEAAGQYAQAGAATAADPIGQPTSIVGEVYVVRTNGVREPLGAGDPIFQGDVIETADGAAVDILFVDKTTFALGGDARLAIDKLVYDPTTHEGSSSYSVLKGIFVFSSGEIAKINPLDMTVKTTVATIGIRGTKVAGEVNPAGEDSKFTILEGEIIVLTDEGYVVLSDQYETTFVTGFDAPPSDAVIFSSDEIDSFYSAVKGVSKGFYDSGSTTDEGSDGEAGGDSAGEGNAEAVEQLAASLNDLAPAAGPGGEAEGEGAAESEGGFVSGGEFIVGDIGESFRPENVQFVSFDSGGSGGRSDDDSSNPLTLPEQTLVGAVVTTTVGGAGNDVLIGTEGDDFIDGGDGDDIINGGPGDDTLIGGAGNDLIVGDDGNDTVDGGDGDDVIVAGSGAGNDSYDGGAGNDTIVFTSSDSPVTVDLETGSASGAETGIDSIVGIEHVLGGAGADRITGNDADNSLLGGGGDDVLIGGSGDDELQGDAGRDTLEGGSGDDVLRGGSDNDVYRVALGGGNDRIVDDSGDGDRIIVTGVSESLAEFNTTARLGDDLVISFGDQNIVIADHFGAGTVETITFEFEDAPDRTMILATGQVGGDADGVIVGTDANENLDGGGGDDVLIGNGGNDNMVGGAGNDTFLISGSDDGFDRVTGDDGFDLILGGDEDDVIGLSTFTGVMTVEMIDGGGGENVIRGTSAKNVFDFSETTLLNIARIEGDDGSDRIIGSAADDTIVGGGGKDSLSGGGGDDTFLLSGLDDEFDYVGGDSGFDRILGGDGNDIIGLKEFHGDFSVEEIDGGAGENVIRGTSNKSVFDFSETLLTNIARIEGDSGTDTIIGSAGDDTIVGGGGKDSLNGGEGDDTFLFLGSDNDFDYVSGGSGADRILGGDGDDIIGLREFGGDLSVEEIDGGAGENVIRGTSSKSVFDFSDTVLTNIARIEGDGGSDTIVGSAGDDTIVGGGGKDSLSGGEGNDTFLVSGSDNDFDYVNGGSGTDLILGGDGDDVIGLREFGGDLSVEKIDGGAGENVIRGTSGKNALDFSETVLTNIARIETGGGSDTIIGSAGDDTIVGGSGRVSLSGGGGDDRLVVENDDFKLVDGGAGTDTVGVDFALDLRNVQDSRLQGIESFDLRGGSDASLTVGLDDVLAATDGVNALTGGEFDLVIRRGADDSVNVIGESWDVSAESIDTDGDGAAEGYTVFNDSATGATVYVENVSLA